MPKFNKSSRTFLTGSTLYGKSPLYAKKEDRPQPTFEGTDEYRAPQDIPAREYRERGMQKPRPKTKSNMERVAPAPHLRSSMREGVAEAVSEIGTKAVPRKAVSEETSKVDTHKTTHDAKRAAGIGYQTTYKRDKTGKIIESGVTFDDGTYLPD